MNQRLKHLLLTYTPSFLLSVAKSVKKNKRRKELQHQKKSNVLLSEQKLINDLTAIGIKDGDAVLVHCSLSKIGYVDGGAKTIINALQKVIGVKGTLLMPAFPAPGRNITYLESNPVFDIINTPSQMGIVSEFFRKLPTTKRSLHPTDSICANGPLANYFTNTHFNQLTPYNENSPFRKLCDQQGKILMLGTTLNGACTNLHTLEDAVDFKFPVYSSKLFSAEMIDANGEIVTMTTKVHNPLYSEKRNCDALKPLFEKENVLVNGIIGEAKSMLIDAQKMLEVMILYYLNYGVTMYTPFGENDDLKY